MKNYIKNLVALLLTVVIVLTTFLPVTAVTERSSYSTSSNSGERDEICTSLSGTGAGDYYTGSYSFDSLTSQSSSQLLQSLHKLMTDTHKKISSYDECRDLATKTDCENNDGKILMIYSSYSATYSQYKGGQGWNREHVWPKSLGGGNQSGGGADLHHIRPSESVINSTRGNYKYGNVTGGTAATGNLSGIVGGYRSGAYFEPLDNVKGDVARICLYVYVRWGSAWGADSITDVFQSVDVLLEWCEMDPVDTWEMGRNEVIENIQGNRNVFIDYPELAWLIFGKSVPNDMTTPSGGAASGDIGGNQGGNEGGNQGGNEGGSGEEICTHKNVEIRGFVAANCQQSGYSGDKYCSDCGELISLGDQIPQSENHSFGDWILGSDGMSFVSVCTVCGTELEMTVDNILATVDSEAEKILILLALGSSDLSILDAMTK